MFKCTINYHWGHSKKKSGNGWTERICGYKKIPEPTHICEPPLLQQQDHISICDLFCETITNIEKNNKSSPWLDWNVLYVILRLLFGFNRVLVNFDNASHHVSELGVTEICKISPFLALPEIYSSQKKERSDVEKTIFQGFFKLSFQSFSAVPVVVLL